MKEIYMEQTLMLIAQLTRDKPEVIQGIINSGTLKQTESGIRYLLIESKTENNEK
jgi:hypothetical protein